MKNKRTKKKGFVYLLIDTKTTVNGMHNAKYGCTSVSVSKRLYRAEKHLDCKFDVVVSVEVDDCFSVENKIKWGLKGIDGDQVYCGSEYFPVHPDFVNQTIDKFLNLTGE